MCGIIVTKQKDKIPLIEHRGIEQGKLLTMDGYYAAHHRLPIQTLKGDDYSQPLILRNGGILMFNGEIFNFPKEFDNDVEYLQYLFNTYHIEVILQKANNWDGFWSIVFIREDGMTFAFCDPLGKKQLYYNLEGEICSEIRPLINSSPIDEYYKSAVFKWGYTITDKTPWERVKRIMPNQVYVFFKGNLVNNYKNYFNWFPSITDKSELKDLLFTSVKNRLVSKKYKIGVLISGGLDSSIIAYILNELEADVNYYSIENDESEYVEMLGKHLNIRYNYLNYEPQENIEEIFKWNETPVDLGSVIPQHNIFSIIPERVVLSGDGADELFGGYKRINDYDSQFSDVFEELPFYHLPRLDRASMRYTIELRNPFLSHDVIKYALKLPYLERVNKYHLKQLFHKDLPLDIIARDKLPLKNPKLVEDPKIYRKKIFKMFYDKIKNYEN